MPADGEGVVAAVVRIQVVQVIGLLLFGVALIVVGLWFVVAVTAEDW